MTELRTSVTDSTPPGRLLPVADSVEWDQVVSGYARAVEAWTAAGWRGVLPLPARRKTPPPAGYTGAGGAWPTEDTIAGWIATGAPNACLRLPDGVVGVDVDAYGSHAGAETLGRMEGCCGPLPATWTVTSRTDSVSGIRLYRAPAGISWRGEAGPGIDIIQHRHRYVVLPPSIHPEGRTYRLIGPGGDRVERPPTVDDLPALPTAWVDALREPTSEPTSEPDREPTSEPLREPVREPLRGRIGDGPLDRFKKRATVSDVRSMLDRLGAHGWKAVGDLWHGTRPDKTTGTSVVVGLGRNGAVGNIAHVHTNNWPGLPAGTYTASDLLVVLHGGDARSAAAEVLDSEGVPKENGGDNGGSVIRDDAAPDVVDLDPDYSDIANARRLAATIAGRYRFVSLWGRWIRWDGRRWAVDDHGSIVEEAKRAARVQYERALAVADDTERKAAVRWATQSAMSARLAAAVSLAQTIPGVPVDVTALDADPWLLNVANGTVDLRTGQLRPHDPGDLITRCCPDPYDVRALAPSWRGFLERVLPADDLRQWVQKLIGYTASGRVDEHVMPILSGSGANGKSTFIEVVRHVLGDYGRAADPELMMAGQSQHPEGVARLRGSRLVTAQETDDGRRLAEAKVKQLTGGDRITARELYGHWFEFDPTFKVVLSTNHRPAVAGTDEGIWRRLVVVPFEVTIPAEDRDSTLPDRLRAEGSGILAWIVTGAVMWAREGLKRSASVEAATAAYRSDNDILGAFLGDCCVVDPAQRIRQSVLYSAYETWADENGERKPMSNTAFGSALRLRGFERIRAGGGTSGSKATFYGGIGLVDGVRTSARSTSRSDDPDPDGGPFF